MTDEEIVRILEPGSRHRGMDRADASRFLSWPAGRISNPGFGCEGHQKMRRLRELPAPTRLARAGLRRPYRSVATWYLWRCLDIELPTA